MSAALLLPHASPIPRSLARMMTGIEWASFTINSWTGCTAVAANAGGLSGCDICYAKTFVERHGWAQWGPGQPRYRVKGWREKVRRIDRAATAAGIRFSIFSLSLGDWLDPEVDPTWRDELVETVEATTSIDWLLLTHRPHLIRKLVPAWADRLPDHVWPGVTVDHPVHARRWDQLAEAWGDSGRAWVSAEPLLGSLAGVPFDGAVSIIAGGASNTRDPRYALDPDWIVELLDAHGPEKLFFKQYGVFKDGAHIDKRAAGRVLEGNVFDHTPWQRHRGLLAGLAGKQPNNEGTV